MDKNSQGYKSYTNCDTSLQNIVANIDLAPTFLDLVDGSLLPNVDGMSIKPYLCPDQNSSHPLRNYILIEHTGEYIENIEGCPQYKDQEMNVCKCIHCIICLMLINVWPFTICFLAHLNRMCLLWAMLTTFVRCALSLKHFLLWKHSLDFDQTSQEWSLCSSLLKLFNWFCLMHK